MTMLSTHLTNVRLVCPGEEDAELSGDEREGGGREREREGARESKNK